MSRERRVVLFLVEGSSEEASLVAPFRRWFASRGGDGAGSSAGASARADDDSPALDTRSETFYCDVTTVHMFPGDATFSVRSNVRDTVRQFVLDRIESRHAYDWGDIDRIVHIVDLDGAFVPDDCIRQGTGRGFVYGEDFIAARKPESVAARNREKAASLRDLVECRELTYKRRRVPYGVYFLSCNLEHALYGLTRDCTNREKRLLSTAFDRKIGQRPQAFARLLRSDAVRVPGDDLDATWDYVQQGTRSLERGSNLFLVLEQGEMEVARP